jgi:hypothetical protein
MELFIVVAIVLYLIKKQDLVFVNVPKLVVAYKIVVKAI